MDNWHNCYDDSWKGIIVPEAFAHPAKMSRGLTNRIFKHALSKGWLKKGDVVVDPFGGIGSTGIVGAYLGIDVLCCELEMKFCKLAMENFNMHAPGLKKLGLPRPQIIQGDSRRLSEVIAGADCVVSSPPYAQLTRDANADYLKERLSGEYDKKRGFKPNKNTYTISDGYGQTPGQLGAMKPGSIEAIISSPPYAETLKGDGTQKETAAESRAKRVTAGGSLGQSQRTQGYGSKGNLGNLKPGEPVPKGVDAVVKKGLTNKTVSDSITIHENKKRKTTNRKHDTQKTSKEALGEAERRDCLSLPDSKSISASNGSILQSNTAKHIKDTKDIGNQGKRQRTSGKEPSTIQTRQGKPNVSDNDREGQMPGVRNGGESGNPPQERRPLRQSTGESGNSLQFMSSEHNKKEVVEGQKSGTADTKEQCADGLEPIDCIVSSPPFEGCQQVDNRKTFNKCHADQASHLGWGTQSSESNLGNDKGETFWQAARQIVAECHKILKPGGHAIWVVKSFVRKGAIVDFPGDWRRLCEAQGFTTVCEHHVMLVKETRHNGLFEEIVETKERKSFFRRLAEKKGSPKIDYEVVLCTKK